MTVLQLMHSRILRAAGDIQGALRGSTGPSECESNMHYCIGCHPGSSQLCQRIEPDKDVPTGGERRGRSEDTG